MAREYYSPFEIVRLEKYSDEIIRLSRNLVLKMNVSLAKTVNDNRFFYYREYEYTSTGTVKRVSIKRSFDYYLSLEEINKPKDKPSKIYVRINQADYYPFWMMINQAKEWFSDDKYKNLYGVLGGGLVIAAPTLPSYTLPGLPMGINIEITPAIVDTGYIIKHGIEMMIETSGRIESFSITADMIFALYTMFPPYYNMYHEASTMLAALNMPLGTNRVDLNDSDKSHALPSYTEEREFEQKKNNLINGRKIGQSTSIDDLEGS